MQSNHRKDKIDFLIVGGGCIGTSTVVALKRKWLEARIVWYAGNHEHTASNDFLKIIRDAYPDPIMVEYANRAMQKWKTAPYCDYFHQTSWIQAIDRNTKKTMNKGQSDEKVTNQQMMSLVGSTAEPLLSTTEELFLNRNVGYADSDLAVQAVYDNLAKLGVELHKENVTRLVIEVGKCVGVEVGDSIVRAEKTIVSAGAWTPSLLEKSDVAVPPGFFQVSAVGVAVLELSEEEFNALRSMPILVTENGEVMLSRAHKVLKMTTTETFRIGHPDELSDAVDITPNREVLEKMLPQFGGRELKSFSCPDLLTLYQYPIVDEVKGIQQLTLATGGSYHSYKLMTIIGEIVVLRICGEESNDELERTVQARCKWERHEGIQPVHPNIVPKREMPLK
ncbi:DAO-domain-containing protein [Mytilinidion resinicola]|uniref:DAO-domain-containing protein n=1 Tax=Mytilinidion resinicola TaxID=574789 RepID=A0A6A6XZE7_9PEZI|nr:DAO-domain-containing protein [Mytilinidion resinicola]KAF2801780.1 DAO-domain-containing protein [Mytilinidion resinicola]